MKKGQRPKRHIRRVRTKRGNVPKWINKNIVKKMRLKRGMGYFENPEERGKIFKKFHSRFEKSNEERNKLVQQKDNEYQHGDITKLVNVVEEKSFLEGYTEALMDLGLVDTKVGFKERYGRPEKKKK